MKSLFCCRPPAAAAAVSASSIRCVASQRLSTCAACGKIASAKARNCDREGRKDGRSTAETTSTRGKRLASTLLASAALVVVLSVCPPPPMLLFQPFEASAKETIADDDPISFFQLRGSVAKKYAIEEVEEKNEETPSSSSSPPSPPSSSPPSPSSSSRVIKRKAGLTVAACVAEGRGPRGGELNAALASAAGAASAPTPTACGRAEDESRANLPRACASACAQACSAAVERKNELLRSTTGFSLGESAVRRLGRSCARACGGECIRPSTSSARAYDFFVNFGR